MTAVRLWLLALCCLTACIRPGTTTCADGTVCPDGTVCAPDRERTLCVRPEQLTACDEHAEREDCAFGRCYAIDDGLVCAPKACGNGFRDDEEGEQCDDANTVSLDGCSADCLSSETCGNGVIDAVLGEECDDGNQRSADGCASSCVMEQPRWRAAPAGSLAPTTAPAVTFDARRGRVVVYGGLRGQVPIGAEPLSDATSEWDLAWTLRSPRITPGGRSHASMVYDSRRGRTLLFGGARQVGFHADTWAWSGTQWTPLDAVGPAPRKEAAMAYDPIGDRTILFGGSGEKPFSDTWVLQGDTWTQISESLGEGLRPAMTFDPTEGAVVLVHGGMHYRLDGTTWTLLGEAPAAADRPTFLVVDPRTRKRILVGKVETDLGSNLRAWAWTADTWQEESRAALNPLAVGAVIADTLRGALYVLSSGKLHAWEADGLFPEISEVHDGQPAVIGGAAANDLARHSVVWVGGAQGSRASPDALAQVLLYDGVRWRALDAMDSRPSARWRHAMAYDPVRERVVLFGGQRPNESLLGDTWEWDGATWTQVATTGPSPRAEMAMAYSGLLKRVVLFGGQTSSTVAEGDLWAWDGTAWQPISSQLNPSARAGAMMASDPRDGSLLMFGGGAPDSEGFGTLEPLEETWRFTTEWKNVDPAISPQGRARGSLVCHPARRTLILVGGEVPRLLSASQRTPSPVSDTWEWDGARWRALVDAPRTITWATGFASPDGRAVLSGGGLDSSLGTSLGSAFALGWEADAGEETCRSRVDADADGLVGCADPDCWWRCTPSCMPGLSCAPSTCGDGTCDATEDSYVCVADCSAPVVCGDLACDTGETCSSDCP